MDDGSLSPDDPAALWRLTNAMTIHVRTPGPVFSHWLMGGIAYFISILYFSFCFPGAVTASKGIGSWYAGI